MQFSVPSIETADTEPKVIFPKEIALKRASRISFATDAPIEEIEPVVYNGQEDMLRSKVARKEFESNLSVRARIVEDVIKGAEQLGRPLTDEEKNLIANAPLQDAVNPKTILESKFAEKYLTTVTSTNRNQLINKAINLDPDYVQGQLDITASFVAKSEVNRRLREELSARKSSQPFSTVLDYASAMLIPFRETAGVAQALGASGTESVVDPGERIAKEAQRLMSTLDINEYEAEVSRIVKELASTNPVVAERFLDELDNVTSNHQFMVNSWNAMEALFLATDVLAPSIGFAKLGKKAKQVRKASQDVAQAVSNSKGTPHVAQVLNDVGDVESASTARAIEDIQTAFVQGANTYDAVEGRTKFISSRVPSIFRLDQMIKSTPNFSGEATRRLISEMTRTVNEGLQGFINTKAVRRRTDETLQELYAEAKTKLKTRYDGTKVSVIDNTFRSVDQSETAENLGRVYALIGDEKGYGWEDSDTAYGFAKDYLRMPRENFKIVQKGNSFFIETFQDLDESLTTQNLRSILVSPEAQTPVSFTNTFIGFLRNPADVLSKFQTKQRDVATFASQETLRLMKTEAESMTRSLNKKERKELVRALEALREDIDSEGNPGRFAKDTFDFEKTFVAANGGKMPTPAQTEAYFRSVMINDFEHFVRNLELRKDKARLGIEQVHIPTHNTQLGMKSLKIEGKRVDDLPYDSDEDFGVLIFDNKTGKREPLYIRRGEEGWDVLQDTVQKLKDEGFRIIQVANPDQMPFENPLGIDDKVNFVLLNDARISPLSMKQLNYQGGGHKIYRDPWYVKQAKITLSRLTNRRMLRGDTSILNAVSEAEAKAQARWLEEARKAYKRHDIVTFEQVSHKLGRNPSELRDAFEMGKIDPDIPFVVTRAGMRTQDDAMMKKFLEDEMVSDLIDSRFNLFRNVQKKFTGERDPDLDAGFMEGSENNPVFRLTKPRLLDPLQSINKGLTNVMRARQMEDYKMQAVEHYIAEFGDLMNMSADEMLTNPLDALHNPNWKEGMDAGRLAAAKNSRMSIRHLLGTPSPIQEKINWTMDKLTSDIWRKYGTESAQRFSDATLWTATDPFAYARAFAFHTKLGLFNPVQLWLQAQTWSNLAGIAPKQVLPASAAAMKMASLRYTNKAEVIRGIAGMGEKALGMSQKEFIESYTAMRKTGIFNVAGEVAWRDDVLDPKMNISPFSSFLEKGTMFFKEGERFARLSAWNIAYLQWRRANPAAKLSDTVLGDLINRTNDLTVNMIRSNNAAYQQGIFSIPTQFWSYQLRLMELYMGGRLTNAEKIRMFSAHSLLYGVPVATGAVTGVYPWYEDLRQGFLERGVDVNAPTTQALLSGIPSLLLKGITGNNYNFAERYGPGGLNVIKEIAQEEKTFVELLGGASASILLDSASGAAPAWTGIVNFLLGREGPELTSADFTRALSTISTVNQLNKAYHMVNSAKYITKNGIKMGDADDWDAFAIATFGLTNQKVPDTFLRIKSMQEWNKEKQKAYKEYSRNIRNFLNSNDIEDKTTYLTNARVIMESSGLLPQERAQWIHRSVKDIDVVEQTSIDFWQKAPLFQQEQRLKEYMSRISKEEN